MEVSLVIRQRLKELGLEQRDLAVAARVTDSYVSQLLASKKAPPAPNRTELYPRIESFLQLPRGHLARLAEIQRREELKKKVTEPPPALFRKCRALILRKCAPQSREKVRAIIEKDPFGMLEHVVTRTLLQFSEADALSCSMEEGVARLAPRIECWDIDLETFAMEIVLREGGVGRRIKRFGFLEKRPEEIFAAETGFDDFLKDRSLSGDATEEEIEFLRALRFRNRSPAAIYYYRELQNLRDPLHFRS